MDQNIEAARAMVRIIDREIQLMSLVSASGNLIAAMIAMVQAFLLLELVASSSGPPVSTRALALARAATGSTGTCFAAAAG